MKNHLTKTKLKKAFEEAWKTQEPSTSYTLVTPLKKQPMTLDQLLEQFEKEFPTFFEGYLESGSSVKIMVSPQQVEDWLRTHITEMVKGAVGEDEKLMRFEIEGAKGSVDVDGYRYRNKLRAEILNKLGIEK